MPHDPSQDTPGFFGKLPGRGDFVTRRLPRPMVSAWDQWLAQAIENSQQSLGARWLEAYLSSPLWRFYLAAGACGDMPWTGVMMPSVDRVGRYFPLTVAVPVPAHVGANQLLHEGAGWFEGAETLMLSVLDEHQHGFDLESFSAAVGALGQPVGTRPAVGLDATAGAGIPVRLEVAQMDEVAAVHDALSGAAFHAAHPQMTVWWTSGSEHLAPCMLYANGLPAPDYFASMLVGAVGAWRSSPSPGAAPVTSSPYGEAPLEASPPADPTEPVPSIQPGLSPVQQPPPREPTDITVPTVRSDSTVPKRPPSAPDAGDG